MQRAFFRLPAFTLLLTYFGALSTPAYPVELDHVTRAYSWSPVDRSLDHVVPFHWLHKSDLVDIDAMVDAARAATSAMPEGHRVLFSWDLHRDMAWNPSDVLHTPDNRIAGCKNREGGFTHYRSIWWDEGVDEVRNRIDDWFRRFAASGGEADTVVLDFEQGLSYWHLLHLAQQRYDCGIDGYLQAIQSDPRFAKLKIALGFDDLSKLNEWYKTDEFLRWDAVMRERVARYVSAAVYEPIRKYFPNIKFSNYGYYYQHPQFHIPDINGHDRHRYSAGLHVGTHQARQFYGWLEQITDRSLDGEQLYAATPFNALRYELNKLRAMKISSQLPIFPWIANKEFENSLLRDSDLYQELIFHIALSGVDSFLFWNPLSTPTPATPSSNRLLNGLLAEIDAIADRQRIRSGRNPVMPWAQPYVLTSATVDGCNLWRFTPIPREGETAEETILQRDPARFRLGQDEIKITSGVVFELEKPNSKAGFWIRQRDCLSTAASDAKD